MFLKRLSLRILLKILLVSLFSIVPITAAQAIKFGLHQNKPLNFQDKNGVAKGLVIDVFNAVADKEGWQVEYVPCDWASCLEKLKSGDIDVLSAIGYTKVRSEVYDFTETPLITNWGLVITQPDTSIDSILDLSGKRIAVMKQAGHTEALKSLLKSFNISAEYLEVDSFMEVFQKVHDKQVDAGVVNRLLASKYDKEFNILKSSVIFNPIEIRYAFHRGDQQKTIATLDRYLAEYHKTPDSIYQQSLARWFGDQKRSLFPTWLMWGLGGTLLIIVVLIIVNALLNARVKSRTAALKQEVNEHNRAEKELTQVKNFLDNIVNSMPSVLIGVDASGLITHWNRCAERFLEIPAEQAIGKPLAELLQQLPSVYAGFRDAIKSRHIFTAANVVWTHGETTHYIDETIYPLISNGVIGAVIRLDNVTERKRMEEVMVQSEKMLSIGGLAAGMAHELNNPLAGMMQNTQVLRNRLSKDLPRNLSVAEELGCNFDDILRYAEARQLFSTIEGILTSGAHAAEVINNMLSFSRKSESKSAPTDLAELVDKAMGLAASDYNLREAYDFRHIKIVKQYVEPLPKVPCESSKIQQVLLNLFKNSAQAMLIADEPQQLPQLTIRLYADNQWATIEVEDNGPGMSEEIQHHIFEPFFTTKKDGIGTGLGLSVSHFIVTQNHGGDIFVNSTPGSGSIFTIKLPIQTPNSQT